MFSLFPRPEWHRAQYGTGSAANSHRKSAKPIAGEAAKKGHATIVPESSQLYALPDVQLIEQVAAGDEDASAVLLERYREYVFSTAFAVLRDRGEAQDVVQETFWELCRTAKRFDSAKGSFPAWVYLIASHTAVKRKHHLRMQPSYNALPMEGFEADLLTWTTEFSLTPQEQDCLVDELLKTLKPAEHWAIVLKFRQGLTAEQGAGRTGKSSSCFENHLYRGLKKLRDLARKK